MENKDFFTIKEIAEILGISRVAVLKKVKKGQIEAFKIGRNFVVHKNELDVILNKKLTNDQKRIIEQGVKKAVDEYGTTLKLLGQE